MCGLGHLPPRQLVIFTDSSRNSVIVYNRLDYSGYGTVLYAWAKRPSSSHYRSELHGWFWRENTSVVLRTSRDEDVKTAVTLGYVSLFDVDFSILCALPYGLLEPRRSDTETDQCTPKQSCDQLE